MVHAASDVYYVDEEIDCSNVDDYNNTNSSTFFPPLYCSDIETMTPSRVLTNDSTTATINSETSTASENT